MRYVEGRPVFVAFVVLFCLGSAYIDCFFMSGWVCFLCCEFIWFCWVLVPHGGIILVMNVLFLNEVSTSFVELWFFIVLVFLEANKKNCGLFLSSSCR